MELSKEISNKIISLETYFKVDIQVQSKNVIATYFVYEKLTENLISLLELFIETNLKFNKQTTIYVFTNHLDLKVNRENRRVKFLYFPYIDKFIMTNRVIFNYYAIKLFSSYKTVFLFDTDLIPIKPFEEIFTQNYDVGLTISNDWFKNNKFPINAGFLICNNSNKKKIKNFRDEYLYSYNKTLKLEKKILDLKIIKHKQKNLAEWWGDQYLYLVMFNFKLPNNIQNYYDFEKNNISLRFFNEWFYNHQCVHLKYQDISFNIKNYLENLKDIFFIHLKGENKKFSKKIFHNLINNN